MRNVYSPAVDMSGEDEEGEIAATGSGPPLYTGAAASVMPEKMWPITAETPASYKSVATNTAESGSP
jgi:hypothetical protein